MDIIKVIGDRLTLTKRNKIGFSKKIFEEGAEEDQQSSWRVSRFFPTNH